MRLNRACFSVLAAALLLCGCAGMLPGGKETVNAGFYKTSDELTQRAAELEPGMSKADVFAKLGRSEADFRRLSREEVFEALFGGKNATLPGATPGEQLTFLENLEGFRLQYKAVKRRHGFTSPIAIRTDRAGFDYALNLIFYDGALLEKPVVAGGNVLDADTKTLFDYLNPGLVFSAR
jgi:hypothetical protein